jgi:hypothetical protein
MVRLHEPAPPPDTIEGMLPGTLNPGPLCHCRRNGAIFEGLSL